MAHGRHSGLWASFLLCSTLERNWAEVLIQDDTCAHPHWDSQGQLPGICSRRAVLFLQGTLEEGQERDTDWLRGEGDVFHQAFHRSHFFLIKEVVQITTVALMELAGPQSYSSPENDSILQLTSSLNLIFCLLISTSWLKASGGQVLRLVRWVGACVFGNLTAIVPSTEPIFKMSMMN